MALARASCRASNAPRKTSSIKNSAYTASSGQSTARRSVSTAASYSGRIPPIVSRYIERICSVMFENVARSKMCTTGGGTSKAAHTSSRFNFRVSMYCASSAVKVAG